MPKYTLYKFRQTSLQFEQFIYKNSPSESASQTPDFNDVEPFNEVGKDTRDALKNLAKEFHPDNLSPVLVKVQEILLSLKEGEAKRLPIDNALVYAIRDKGELVIINGEKIPSIADWLEQRKNDISSH